MGGRSVVAYRSSWIALIVLLMLGLAVVLGLPPLVPEPEPAPQPLQATAPSAEPAATNGERVAAERLLRDYLSRRARLELAGAQRWGEPQWSQAAGQAEDGDRLFARQRFATARQRYAQALDSLKELESDREPRLARALESGRRDLDADRAAAAIAQFERALAIEPTHRAAREQLARARVRDQVIGWLERGDQAQESGDLEAARNAYRQALQLDDRYAAAASALERVERRLEEEKFRLAMSETLAALDGERLGEAGQALARAAALKPADEGVLDAGRRLDEARRRVQLKRLREAAAERVDSEDWDAASRLYQQALALEPGAAFARQGIARSQARSRLHRQLDRYLDEPSRLYSPEPRAAAERLLNSIGTAPVDQPRLARKLATLHQRVEQAATPLPITLHSDGETEVVIYHVGRLGRFEIRRLELRPGTYTAVGSRPGYRDVRRVFTVRPGEPLPPLQLSCEEPV
jgi:tetratricopeptide (TPR) repeat protein